MDRRTKIIVFACVTRLIVITVQFITNVLIPDHDANVFLYPKANLTSSVTDKAINVLLGGFIRWDAQYFMHVAKYGYTYESTLAFFPLYPLLAKTTAALLSPILIFLNEDSLLLVAFIVLNVFLFVKAALILQELSLVILDENLAYKATILFCINPATIFFVAPYTECLFSYLSFKSMLNCVLIYGKHSNPIHTGVDFKSIIYVIIPISLSTCTRSNGTLNIGFIAYFMTQYCIKRMRSQRAFISRLLQGIKSGVILVLTIFSSLVPFSLVQVYDYSRFCRDFEHKLPNFLVNFAESNHFILPGMVSQYKQTWCFKHIPLAYSYIQEHYWNVGFLKYFEIKQIPNFMLALPIVTFVLLNSINFIMLHKAFCLNLGIFNWKFSKFRTFAKQKTDYAFKPEMFVFIVHAVFLVVFCVFCIHVQVTTRMICSASPVVYWFGAYWFEKVKESDDSLYYIFLFNKNKSKKQKYLLYYFLVYFFIGTALFCNFLPWT